MTRRNAWLLLIVLSALIGGAVPVRAVDFASPLFRVQWLQGEGITTNFWGPSGTEGLSEIYADAPGGTRLVQYFDKGRMELNNPSAGIVTDGLLAKELATGNEQIGDSAFTYRDPPAIPLAGDLGGAGPTYAILHTTGAPLFTPTPARDSAPIAMAFSGDGRLTTVDPPPGGPIITATYDGVTQHNVLAPFAKFRDEVGLDAIGYAICEPFLATFTIAGTPRTVAVQVFERRVLTYTESNPDPFKTEFGNIGRHYYQWRYGR